MTKSLHICNNTTFLYKNVFLKFNIFTKINRLWIFNYSCVYHFLRHKKKSFLCHIKVDEFKHFKDEYTLSKDATKLSPFVFTLRLKKIIFGSIRIESDCGKLLLWGNFRLWKCHYVLFIQDSCHGWKSLSNVVQTFGFQVLCQFFKGQNKHKLTTLNKNNSIWIKRWHKDFKIHKKLYWIIIIWIYHSALIECI